MSEISIGERKLINLKNKNTWLDVRLGEIALDHKIALFELCRNVPSIVDHLEAMLERIELDSKTYATYWKVSENEGKLLLLLALPRQNDEFEYTDVSLLLDSSGKNYKK